MQLALDMLLMKATYATAELVSLSKNASICVWYLGIWTGI